MAATIFGKEENDRFGGPQVVIEDVGTVSRSVEGLVDVPINLGGESFISRVDRGADPIAGVGVSTDISLSPDISNASRL
ncbi:hypothetical protein V6N13_053446 [Hibiscus sabdariffa]